MNGARTAVQARRLLRKTLKDPSAVVQGACLATAAVAAWTTLGGGTKGKIDDDDDGAATTSQWYHHNPARTFMEAAFSFPLVSHLSGFRRYDTLERFHKSRNDLDTVRSKYSVKWTRPIGQGTFGAVYLGTNRRTGEPVAVKQISKAFTDNVAFQREIEALMQIRQNGGHPNICALQENFDEGDYYYLVLDLVSGGEMFDRLCAKGAYSEADAARLVREVASALAFMHGVGIVHGDMKPENLMLSTKEQANSVIKVVDFGSAHVTSPDAEGEYDTRGIANTPAYSPPEVLDKETRKAGLEPSFDMWALGIIVYIMLTGVHPFDLYGNATDEEIEEDILKGKEPPLKSPLTAHLSQDAVALITGLLARDPQERLTAQQLLDHPWVRGETARTNKMADSDKRLSAYRAFKTKFEAKVFADMVQMASDNINADDVTRKTSLIEHTFQRLNPDRRGFVTTKTVRKLSKEPSASSSVEVERLSLSGFSDILSENMKNIYFPKGHLVYSEGDKGHAMYFINSGSVEVSSGDGVKTVRKTGESFGEGALLHPEQIRSASIRTLTPVHAIEISRDYFEKYISTDEVANLNLREKDKLRKRQRAKALLKLQQNMKPLEQVRGDYLFRSGEEATDLFIVEEGHVNLMVDGHVVVEVKPGEMTGENSFVLGRPRNVDAVCVSDTCKLQVMRGADFLKLLETQPSLRESIRDICMRRDLRKAICAKIRKPFPKTDAELREAFRMVNQSGSGSIELRELRVVIQKFDPRYTEKEIRDILNALDLNHTGKISWAEFKKMFGVKKSYQTVQR